jgi:hypothetical protein
MSSVDFKLAQSNPITLRPKIVEKIQNLLNMVAESLLKQGTRCTYNGGCANKNDEGEHCAFGWALHYAGISDEDMPNVGSYRASLQALLNRDEVFFMQGENLRALWYGIQTIHDLSFATTSHDLSKKGCYKLYEKLCIAYPQINFCKWKDIASGDWLI